jgi:hypothetical protein
MTRRAEYEASSLSRREPWRAEGISRRTWYRRQGRDVGTSPSGTGAAGTSSQPDVHSSLARQRTFGTSAPPPELTPEQFAERRASVQRLLEAMAAENERRRDWWKVPPYDRDGNLVIRSILTGATATIRLAKRRRLQ